MWELKSGLNALFSNTRRQIKVNSSFSSSLCWAKSSGSSFSADTSSINPLVSLSDNANENIPLIRSDSFSHAAAQKQTWRLISPASGEMVAKWTSGLLRCSFPHIQLPLTERLHAVGGVKIAAPSAGIPMVRPAGTGNRCLDTIPWLRFTPASDSRL